MLADGRDVARALAVSQTPSPCFEVGATMRIESVPGAGKSIGKSVSEAIFRLSTFGALLVAFLTTTGPLST